MFICFFFLMHRELIVYGKDRLCNAIAHVMCYLFSAKQIELVLVCNAIEHNIYVILHCTTEWVRFLYAMYHVILLSLQCTTFDACNKTVHSLFFLHFTSCYVFNEWVRSYILDFLICFHVILHCTTDCVRSFLQCNATLLI